jgi:hypothetical protein
MQNNTNKIQTLMEIEGFDDSLEMMEAIGYDSVCPGICTNPDCDYTTEVEPDCRNGYCEECNTQTVRSALSLLQLI